MNDAEIKILLKNFLDMEEKLIVFPAKRKKKLLRIRLCCEGSCTITDFLTEVKMGRQSLPEELGL